MGVADYYLVCHGLAHQMTVVTLEMASPPKNPSKKRIKIPDACQALGISFISPFKMLRQERAKFVLGCS